AVVEGGAPTGAFEIPAVALREHRPVLALTSDPRSTPSQHWNIMNQLACGRSVPIGCDFRDDRCGQRPSRCGCAVGRRSSPGTHGWQSQLVDDVLTLQGGGRERRVGRVEFTEDLLP